jgi:hypothetical protein
MDLCYPNDTKFALNRGFLHTLESQKVECGITTQGVLEIVGIRSFNTPTAMIGLLSAALIAQYRLVVIPNPAITTEYASVTIEEVLTQMAQKMSLGDAVMAVQIAKYAPQAAALVTWNAKHFRGKLVVPVFTPEEWLSQQSPPPGNMP